MSEDFLSSYLQYASNTEVPATYHRWCAIAGLGAFLGRRYYFTHGHFTINPNIYCMLVGVSGTRKSTAIKLIRKLLTEANYNTFAAEKTTKEKFILDLSGETEDEPQTYGKKKVNVDDILDKNLWGDEPESKPDAELFIAADEFNDFFGNGNVEFISLLGTLWDYSGVYRNRIKNGKSVSINNPTVSILGGNTPTNLALAFPPEIIGQGFFSRLLFIYGEPNGRRITFPAPPDPEHTRALIDWLGAIRKVSIGGAILDGQAEKLLDKIYRGSTQLDDPRFESYSTRRFSHLLKLCIIVSASRISNTITESDVIYANTILFHAEQYMPKALGQFGKSKNSDVLHKIVSLVAAAEGLVTFKDIWKHVSSDLEKMTDLSTLLQNLIAADKIQSIAGKGFLPRVSMVREVSSTTVDYSLLTDEEKDMKK
jgi:Protein of unknown function (DUF3987)